MLLMSGGRLWFFFSGMAEPDGRRRHIPAGQRTRCVLTCRTAADDLFYPSECRSKTRFAPVGLRLMGVSHPNWPENCRFQPWRAAVMRKPVLFLICAGLLSEIAMPPLVAQIANKSTQYTRSRRRSSRSRRARNVGIGAAGGAAGGAILGRGRGAGAGAVIGGTAGALTPTRRK